jgi:hypothetical protein
MWQAQGLGTGRVDDVTAADGATLQIVTHARLTRFHPHFLRRFKNNTEGKRIRKKRAK